ncbi:MAG: hypothetical protein WCT49_01485 [Candidatus Paceibacterota bacterium]|jgi:hypothetical protein
MILQLLTFLVFLVIASGAVFYFLFRIGPPDSVAAKKKWLQKKKK